MFNQGTKPLFHSLDPKLDQGKNHLANLLFFSIVFWCLYRAFPLGLLITPPLFLLRSLLIFLSLSLSLSLSMLCVFPQIIKGGKKKKKSDDGRAIDDAP